MAHLESLVGEMPQDSPQVRAAQGAYHAGWVRKLTVTEHPTKKHGGCKACDGRHCLGRCRF
jgi:hypothetical protein